MGIKDKVFDVPVAFIVYKRLDVTAESFEAIRKLQPAKLYIISDGPRDLKEKKQVDEVRRYIDSNIDWNCKVYRNYAPHNMGLRYRMPSGMAWVFEKEDRAIFIEDDIKATQSFFYYCRDMLEHYKNDDRIAMISGNNLYPNAKCFEEDDICFSYFATIWGWATWKRAWKLYDVNIRKWPELKRKRKFKRFMTPNTWKFFSIVFDDLQYHWYRTWGYQWNFMMWANEKLGIVPRCNLVKNIGMGNTMAEHPDDSQEKIDQVSGVTLKELKRPLDFPDKVKRDKDYDLMFQNGFYTEKIGLFKQIKYAIRAAKYEKAYRVIKEMEKDDEYFNKMLQDKYKLSKEEQKLNPGDRYKLITPKEMCKSAARYKKYFKKKQKEQKEE